MALKFRVKDRKGANFCKCLYCSDYPFLLIYFEAQSQRQNKGNLFPPTDTSLITYFHLQLWSSEPKTGKAQTLTAADTSLITHFYLYILKLKVKDRKYDSVLKGMNWCYIYKYRTQYFPFLFRGFKIYPSMSTAIPTMASSRSSFWAFANPPGSSLDITVYNQNAKLLAATVGAGNAYMTEIARKTPTKRWCQQLPKNIMDQRYNICSRVLIAAAGPGKMGHRRLPSPHWMLAPKQKTEGRPRICTKCHMLRPWTVTSATWFCVKGYLRRDAWRLSRQNHLSDYMRGALFFSTWRRADIGHPERTVCFDNLENVKVQSS